MKGGRDKCGGWEYGRNGFDELTKLDLARLRVRLFSVARLASARDRGRVGAYGVLSVERGRYGKDSARL